MIFAKLFEKMGELYTLFGICQRSLKFLTKIFSPELRAYTIPGAEDPSIYLYEVTEAFFDSLAHLQVDIDPFAELAVQSRQQQYLSYRRRQPEWAVSDREGATRVAEALMDRHWKVRPIIRPL